MASRSAAAATRDRDDIWDELVLDSGSVSLACPYAWCSDIGVHDKEKAYLQDIQQRRIPSRGSRAVPPELWGLEGNVQCKVKFDVADVAYPVVSLVKMIETGFTFSFDDYKCYMHKGNRRVDIIRKGRIFVLRMRHRWLKSTAHMIAPIDEDATHGAADEEMGMAEDSAHTDDGARAAVGARVDEPGDNPPPTTTTGGSTVLDETRSGSRTTTQPDALPISELVRGVHRIQTSPSQASARGEGR